MRLSKRQLLLLEFVKQMHEGQVRKYTNEPYWNHPYEVATIVSKHEPAGIEAALCHDLYEDTVCNENILHNKLMEVGYLLHEAFDVCNKVKELTNIFRGEAYENTNRADRKHQEAKRLSTISSIAQSVKYADIISNGSSIIFHDEDFGRVYLNEAHEILNTMRKGNISLLIECCYTIVHGLKTLS